MKRPSNHSTLARITTQTKRLPNRVLLHAVQKWGKTSFAAQAPQPVFLCTRGEDGLMTLIDSEQLPPVAHFPDCITTWLELKASLSELVIQPHDYRTIVIDTVNGAERLCHEYVCEHRFANDWGLSGWLSFGAGPRAAVTEFVELLNLLDRLRDKGCSIMLLAHSAPRTTRNPEGADYDRWEPILERPTSSLLARWCDMILFGSFEVITAKETKTARAKAKGQHRLIRCEPDAAYEAGNRHGLPAEIDCGASANEAWSNFIEALRR